MHAVSTNPGRMIETKRSFLEAHRARALRSQASAWNEAGALRTYLDALEEKYGDVPESAEWIAWTRRYVDQRLDPLASPPAMPPVPEVRPDDVKRSFAASALTAHPA